MKSSGFAKTYDAPLSKNRFTSSSKVFPDTPHRIPSNLRFFLNSKAACGPVMTGISSSILRRIQCKEWEEDMSRWNVVEKSVIEK